MSSKRTNVVEFSRKKTSKLATTSASIDVNARIGPAFPALTEEELRPKVTRIVMYGTIRESKHSAKDRSYRNVSQDDILAMLEGEWTLAGEPEWNEAQGNWKYKLDGVDIEGDELVLVVDVNAEMERIEIITKY